MRSLIFPQTANSIINFKRCQRWQRYSGVHFVPSPHSPLPGQIVLPTPNSYRRGQVAGRVASQPLHLCWHWRPGGVVSLASRTAAAGQP